MDWSLRYLDYPNVFLAPNAKRLDHDLRVVLSVKYDRKTINDRVVYLPNYYPSEDKGFARPPKQKDSVNIGCFGAIRPLKNQLIQALAAIEYADKNKQKLFFHINGNRLEGGGDPILHNLRALFAHSTKHELVEHAWQPHANFLDLIATMDLGMQVSFTESFNIVAADMVTVGVPVVTSPEIVWVSKVFHADPTSVDSMVRGLERAKLLGKVGVSFNRFLLDLSSSRATDIWVDYFGDF
jgi:hypothetical protein